MEIKQILASKYDILSEAGRLRTNDVPSHISENLNQTFPIRPYQKEALLRWLDYYESTARNNQPLTLLFNMATGSGKTLIMAAIILDLYTKGYRNIIFFVDKNNIVEKTKDNFLHSNSGKYLFNEKIQINGKSIAITKVNNFEGVDPDTINILFTTTAGLHSTLHNPAENSITYEELTSNKVVLISDEAHHVNSETKSSHNKTEQEQIRSWEYTVKTLVEGHPENILLEFTATIDLSHPAIFEKYRERILYQYDLRAFRQDKYSKDVLIYEVAAEPMDRALQALVISQYRKKVALAGNILLKPVILFKSRTIADSKDFYAAFTDKMSNLSVSDIQPFILQPEGILGKAFTYFNDQQITMEGLVAELKSDFHQERCVIVDSNTIEPATQMVLNRLEEPSNQVRAVFAVDMLNEGWDVLNLFDIVRLYDTRDAMAGRPGNTTIAEAQLIGRGARYYPFGEGEDKDKRKFDLDIDNNLRAIEQLHYHSAHNPRYIQEISQALRESGIMAEETQEQEMILKPEFKNTWLWNEGFVWVNTRVKNDNTDISSLTDKGLRTVYSAELPTGHSTEINPFLVTSTGEPVKRSTSLLQLSRLGTQIIRKALDKDPFFAFNNLQAQFGNLRSITEFITSEQYLGGVSIELTADTEDMSVLTVLQRLSILTQVLHQIKTSSTEEAIRWIGTATFRPVPVKEVIKERVRLKIATSDSVDREYGRSTYQSQKYHADLHSLPWYVYSDNFGTSEEKSLIKTMESLMQELEEKWEDIYLIRNEKFIKIYAFEDGSAFEPDFILFANDKMQGNLSWQIFIEPKGPQFIGDSQTFEDGKEAWKQRFLLQIQEKFTTTVLSENAEYRVLGLPFYSENSTKEQFIQNLREL